MQQYSDHNDRLVLFTLFKNAVEGNFIPYLSSLQWFSDGSGNVYLSSDIGDTTTPLVSFSTPIDGIAKLGAVLNANRTHQLTEDDYTKEQESHGELLGVPSDFWKGNDND